MRLNLTTGQGRSHCRRVGGVENGLYYLEDFILFDALDGVFVNLFADTDSTALLRYMTNTVLITIVSLLIKSLFDFAIIFLSILLLRKNKKKLAVLPCVIAGIWLIFQILNIPVLSVPNYLLISEWGIFDTYIHYFLPYLSNGAVFTFISLILLITGAIIFLFAKKKKV